jgi:hypothetical protein
MYNFIKNVISTYDYSDNIVNKTKSKKRMSSYMDISLDQVKKEFNIISEQFDSTLIKLNPLNFQIFINGFFQAEGTLSIFFKTANSLRLGYYFAIGQNFTPEFAKLMLTLQFFLGGVGKFRLEETSSGNKHLRFVITNKEDINNKVLPYFTMLYGDKKYAFLKLSRILEIVSRISTTVTTDLSYELITLVYSLNPDGQERKVSLTEKLDLFKIKLNSISFQTVYTDNFKLPHLLFIIGLFLGDGSFYYSLEVSTSPKVYIRMICEIATLKYSEANKHLLNLVAQSLGLPNTIIINSSSNTVTLKYRNIKTLKTIFLLFKNNIQWFF